VRDRPERLRLQRLLPRRGGGLEVEQRALFELAVHPDALVRFGTASGTPRPLDVFVLEPGLVRLVRSEP
jgi:hypothetical protein